MRAVAACDFLGAGALPAAAAVCAQLLPGAETGAEEEAINEAFIGVVERTSFGPALLWAVVPLETVGWLAGGVGQEEHCEGDAHVQSVGGMARTELARRASRARARVYCGVY